VDECKPLPTPRTPPCSSACSPRRTAPVTQNTTRRGSVPAVVTLGATVRITSQRYRVSTRGRMACHGVFKASVQACRLSGTSFKKRGNGALHFPRQLQTVGCAGGIGRGSSRARTWWMTRRCWLECHSPSAASMAACCRFFLSPFWCFTHSHAHPSSLPQGLTLVQFLLNLSVLYGTGGARRGCVARVKGVLGGA
jgi:hypothetical protein